MDRKKATNKSNAKGFIRAPEDENMKSNIALIGFMGTGKTTVGKLLAEKLGKTFIETDELIAKRVGKSIHRIFEEDGETRFRELEREVIKEVTEMKNVVISCGGGVVLDRINIERLKMNAVLILLTTSPEVILKRTSNENGRPLLNAVSRLEEIKELLEFRKLFYNSAADFTIDTTNLEINEIVDKIINQVGK
jgi:shikimate kinase